MPRHPDSYMHPEWRNGVQSCDIVKQPEPRYLKGWQQWDAKGKAVLNEIRELVQMQHFTLDHWINSLATENRFDDWTKARIRIPNTVADLSAG